MAGKEGQEVGDPVFFFDDDPQEGLPPIDIVRIGGTIGVRYGQLSIIFREDGDIEVL